MRQVFPDDLGVILGRMPTVLCQLDIEKDILSSGVGRERGGVAVIHAGVRDNHLQICGIDVRAKLSLNLIGQRRGLLNSVTRRTAQINAEYADVGSVKELGTDMRRQKPANNKESDHRHG